MFNICCTGNPKGGVSVKPLWTVSDFTSNTDITYRWLTACIQSELLAVVFNCAVCCMFRLSAYYLSAWSSHRHSGIGMNLFREQKTWISCGPCVSAVCLNLNTTLIPDSSNSFSYALFHFSVFLYIHLLTSPSPPSVCPLSLLFCAFGNSRYFFFVKFDPRII